MLPIPSSIYTPRAEITHTSKANAVTCQSSQKTPVVDSMQIESQLPNSPWRCRRAPFKPSFLLRTYDCPRGHRPVGEQPHPGPIEMRMLLSCQCVPISMLLLSLRWSLLVSSSVQYCVLPQNDLPHLVRTSLAVWLSSSSVLIPFPQYFRNTPEALLNPADLWLSLVILLVEFAVGKIPLHLTLFA